MNERLPDTAGTAEANSDGGNPERATGRAKRHVLFVSYHYPPEASSSGVLRTLKHTQYLPEHGWRVSVLTVRPETYDVVDWGMLDQIPSDTRVIRTRSVDTKKHLAVAGRYPSLLAIPDRWAGWFPWAVRAGLRLMRTDACDAIYSTSPHATAHLIAWTLSRRMGVPWVADFRDPWYEEPPEPDTAPLVHWAARHLERRVVARASRLVTSTPELSETLKRRYPEKPAAAFVPILNGYDEADFGDLPPNSATNERMLMVHAGAINAEYRNPAPVLSALGALVRDGQIALDDIRLRLVGPGPYGDRPELAAAIEAAGLGGVVEVLPRQPYQDALRHLMAADLLLLLQASEDTRSLVPAKLYEYLRAGRPVLAAVLPGATSRLLDDTRGGWAVDPGDTNRLRACILHAYQAWRDNRLATYAADQTKLQRYTRQHLAGQLAALLDDLT